MVKIRGVSVQKAIGLVLLTGLCDFANFCSLTLRQTKQGFHPWHSKFLSRVNCAIVRLTFRGNTFKAQQRLNRVAKW